MPKRKEKNAYTNLLMFIMFAHYITINFRENIWHCQNIGY